MKPAHLRGELLSETGDREPYVYRRSSTNELLHVPDQLRAYMYRKNHALGKGDNSNTDSSTQSLFDKPAHLTSNHQTA